MSVEQPESICCHHRLIMRGIFFPVKYPVVFFYLKNIDDPSDDLCRLVYGKNLLTCRSISSAQTSTH